MLEQSITILKYEYHIASVRFLPGECKEFKHLFKSAIKYNEAEFN